MGNEKQKGSRERAVYLKKLEQFRQLYETSTLSLRQLRQRIGVSHGTIHGWRRKYFPTQPASKRRYQDFIMLYEAEKFSIERITFFLRCSRESTNRYLAKYRREKGLSPL